MAELIVNLDPVAELRRTRKTGEPEPAAAALTSEMAGAAGVSAHVRIDGRHTDERDVKIWKATLRIPITLVLNCSDEMLKLALSVAPSRVVLVSERHEETAPGSGLDLLLHMQGVQRAARVLRDAQVKTFAFMEPDLEQLKSATKAGMDGVVLNSQRYAEAIGTAREEAEAQRLREAAKVCQKYGLQVGAWRGVSYRMAGKLRAMELQEIHVGHAIASRALFTGWSAAVSEMAALLR